MAVNLEPNKEDTLNIHMRSLSDNDVHNILDKVITQMILDSKRENDEVFRRLEKSLFDPNTPIEQLNVDDSLVLKLAYQRK